MPARRACAGHTYYVQRMGAKLGLGVYAVHATFQFSGTPGKRNRMREMLLWHDPPEYHNHPNGFISFSVSAVHVLIGTEGVPRMAVGGMGAGPSLHGPPSHWLLSLPGIACALGGHAMCLKTINQLYGSIESAVRLSAWWQQCCSALCLCVFVHACDAARHGHLFTPRLRTRRWITSRR